MELSGAHKELALWEKATSGEVLGVQVKAGSEGVSMTRARSCVWYSIGYSLREYDQGISRLHRPGQERHVTYWHLVVRNSIDGIAYRALQNRREIIEEIVRGSEE